MGGLWRAYPRWNHARAISKLKNDRAAGPDGIPPELLKSAIGPVAEAQHALLIKVCRSGRIPADWKDRILIALYKGKGAKTECGNYRPITLLFVPGKVFANVLLECIQPLINTNHHPEQSGFIASHSTVDAMLALRLLSDLHREFDGPLNVAFLNVKAAFDSINMQALWKALHSRGIPDFLIDLIAALHKNTGAWVRLGQNFSGRLQTTSRVRQGCALAWALFSIAIDWIFRHMSVKPELVVGRDKFSDLVYVHYTALLINLVNVIFYVAR